MFRTLKRMDQNFDWAAVQEQASQTIELWNACSAAPSRSPRLFTPAEQDAREQAYDEALAAVERELKQAPRSKAARSHLRHRVTAAFARFSAKALDLDDETIEILTNDFLPAGTDLAQRARQFDPDLPMADIIQACRNAWTACGLQPLLGVPVALTPSIFGYSMLYPYSDNILDRQDLSSEAKREFSRRFRRLLQGEDVPSLSASETSLYKLIRVIEEQYPRDRHPLVFACLLAIHRAQEESIRQTDHTRICSDTEILELSCRKGGSSVLADACLAYGYLSEQESRFAFEWGVLLQLGDDLQDVHEDMRRGSDTLFSRAARSGTLLDGLALRLLAFSDKVGDRMDELPHASRRLKNLLKMSWHSLIIRAVADSHEFFSPAFVREAEHCSPFRFAFLRERQGKLAGMHGLYEMLFDAFLDHGEAAPPFPVPNAESSFGRPSKLLC